MRMTDQERADAIAALRAAQNRPLVGDCIRFTDGSVRRISHDWGDEWQHSPEGSFFLSDSGSAEFSGGLDAPVAPLHPTDALLPARFWVWRDGISGPHRRAEVVIPVRVWEYRNEDVQPDTWDREHTLAVYDRRSHQDGTNPNPNPNAYVIVHKDVSSVTCSSYVELCRIMSERGMVHYPRHDRERTTYWGPEPRSERL